MQKARMTAAEFFVKRFPFKEVYFLKTGTQSRLNKYNFFFFKKKWFPIAVNKPVGNSTEQTPIGSTHTKIDSSSE